MSTSKVDSLEPKLSSLLDFNTVINDSCYALYLFSNKKHALNLGSEFSASEKGSTSFKADIEEPSVCLSLLEGNLNAAQETVVRCYLLNTLSLREDLSFENEGKYAVLSFSDESGDPFGCYYHRLSKLSNSSPQEEDRLKHHTFFICLIGPADGIMEPFCPELSLFCCSLINLLDPEGLKNKEDVQLKLKSWHKYCIEYVGRCIEIFSEDIPLVLNSSLWGDVDIIAENEDIKWDLERFIETCSLMANNSVIPPTNTVHIPEDTEVSIKLIVESGRIKVTGKTIECSPYCLKWWDKLKMCNSDDYKGMHSILEGFRLKTVQDLNTLKRLLRKSVNDHYSLYKAFLFLRDSGYEDVLLYHVNKEADVSGETDVLDVILCLQEFIQEQLLKS